MGNLERRCSFQHDSILAPYWGLNSTSLVFLVLYSSDDATTYMLGRSKHFFFISKPDDMDLLFLFSFVSVVCAYLV